jgi:CHAD domain-containing protein
MWAGIRKAAGRAGAAHWSDVARWPAAHSGRTSLHLADAHCARGPARTDAVALAPNASADEAFDAVLHVYARAIAGNVSCVLADNDPEGPHQLRVALRRVRTALRAFRPVVRRSMHKQISPFARDLGAMVGELRDADVMIEELLRPAAADAEGGARVVAALEFWREGIRAKVRANLHAAHAAAFAGDLIRLAQRGDWRPKTKRRFSGPAAALLDCAIEQTWERAEARGARLPLLSQVERHELRKDVKALRYNAELAAAAAPGRGAPPLIAALKRLQTALGYLNDVAMLEGFDPPLAGGRTEFERLRARVLGDLAQPAAEAAAAAAERWRAIAAARRVQAGAEAAA